jgi:hypothetical protein
MPTTAHLSTAGSDSFDFNRDGSHFVIAGVLTRDAQLGELAHLAGRIREGYFNKEPIHASGLAKDPQRLLDVLKSLRPVEFRIHAVVVDKRRLQAEGFRDQSAFYGFLNTLVYQELVKAAPRLGLSENAGKGFLPQFREFVRDRHKPDLFGGSDFGFVDTLEPVLQELAALLADTLMRCFDGSLSKPVADAAMELLRLKLGGIREFPDLAPQPELLPDSRYDAMVAELGLRTARSFIETRSVMDQDAQDQVACARLLLLYFNTYGSGIYLTAGEVMQHLNATRPEALTPRGFQTKVIAPLRDAGVLVVSSASGEHKGYKLPSSIGDLHKFVSHGNSMIIPMLHRIHIFRETIRAASEGGLDILAYDEFREIQVLADALAGARS